MKRRKFLKIAASSSITPLVLNGIPLQSFATPGMVAMNCEGIEDRVLVIVQLAGGNDALNTIIPIDQVDLYSNIRPTIGIPQADLINLDTGLDIQDQVGLHPSMTAIKDLYDQGKMNLIQSVSYNNNNKSHFKATDLWLTGGDSTPPNFNIDTGWMGRYLSSTFPGMAGNPTPSFPDPLGIQLGDKKPSLGFHTHEEHSSAINLSGQDPAGFYVLISEIGGDPIPNVPDSEYGDELNYIMNIENSVSNYAQRITDVFNAGSNAGSYPNYSLANQLKTVARLLAGGCMTKIFLVRIGGYDTHANQVVAGDPTIGKHADLLTQLSESIKAFHDDLEGLDLADRVMTVSFSEFGRKALENGNHGTDHGTLAPMFIFGNSVNPGVTGTNVDLSNLNNGQLQNHQHDYRQVYTTLLQDWLGAPDDVITDTMFDPYLTQKLPIITPPSVVDPACYVEPLPVILSYFFARLDEAEENVIIKWETATEENSHYFDVERSSDGINFEKISRVIAQGTSSAVHNYSEIDDSPLYGTSYYRLKQVDFDNTHSYSPIDTVYLNNKLASEIRIYPNPAKYDFKLVLTAQLNAEVQCTLSSTSGHRIFNRALNVSKGFNKFTFPVDRLSPGQYVLKLYSDALRISESIMMQKA